MLNELIHSTDLTNATVAFRILVITLFAGGLGMERSRKRRGAGIRTYIIVSLGAALTMMTSQYIYENIGNTDLARLGAQVITGVGFIGAGTIIFTNFRQVKGITTAAGLWTSACIGLAVGAGFIFGAFCTWIMALDIMIVFDKWENEYFLRSRHINFFIVFESFKDLRSFLKDLKDRKMDLKDISIMKTGSTKEVSANIALKSEKACNHEKLIDELSSYEGILFVDEI